MEQVLWIYNTLSRRKEVFKPLHAPNVGMYVCGPTVYGDPHLGHARPAITFDILFRYLKHLGYKVRYVRNITDVGHLEHDADEGDDKIEKKARLEQLEPMEIAQFYTNRYHAAMEALNVLPPSIEPHATGHIIEQEQLVQQILDNGFAYESNGSIYELRQKCYDAMNDDFATPLVIAHLFEACSVVNKLVDHKATISEADLKELAETMRLFAFDLLGLRPDNAGSSSHREEAFGKVVDMVLDLRSKAKAAKDWATSDRIRDELAELGFEVKDTKDGATWKLK